MQDRSILQYAISALNDGVAEELHISSLVWRPEMLLNRATDPTLMFAARQTTRGSRRQVTAPTWWKIAVSHITTGPSFLAAVQWTERKNRVVAWNRVMGSSLMVAQSRNRNWVASSASLVRLGRTSVVHCPRSPCCTDGHPTHRPRTPSCTDDRPHLSRAA